MFSLCNVLVLIVRQIMFKHGMQVNKYLNLNWHKTIFEEIGILYHQNGFQQGPNKGFFHILQAILMDIDCFKIDRM